MEIGDYQRKQLCIKWYRDNYRMTRKQAAQYVEIHVDWKNFIVKV